MYRAPSAAGLPPWSWMVQDVPGGRDKLARHLGVSLRSLQRWEAQQAAPRPVMLATFWETRWGRDAADNEAARAADVHRLHAMALAKENAALRRRITQLEGELDQARPAAANLPFWRA